MLREKSFQHSYTTQLLFQWNKYLLICTNIFTFFSSSFAWHQLQPCVWLQEFDVGCCFQPTFNAAIFFGKYVEKWFWPKSPKYTSIEKVVFNWPVCSWLSHLKNLMITHRKAHVSAQSSAIVGFNDENLSAHTKQVYVADFFGPYSNYASKWLRMLPHLVSLLHGTPGRVLDCQE